MVSELTQLRAAAQDTRRAEKTLTTAATHPSRGIDPVQARAEAQAARNALRNQVQRMQMVLQGHRADLDTYTPNIAQVTHESTCQADWKHLQRVLKSIDAVGAEDSTDPAPAASAWAQEAARCWHDLTARRQALSQALRSVHDRAEQGDWHKAGQLLRTIRPELRRLLADARHLAASGDALLLDPDAYNNLHTLLRDIPRRLDNLDRFQQLLDRGQRPVEAD